MKAKEICERASGLVSGDRAAQHGDKIVNHWNIAHMWNAYLFQCRDQPESDLTALDVAHMMALLKIARTQAGSFNADDYIDLAGYAGVAGEIAADQNARAFSRAGGGVNPETSAWRVQNTAEEMAGKFEQ